MNCSNPIVSRRVLGVHHQDFDLPQKYRDAYKGTVIGVYEGCNPTVVVQFDGSEWVSHMAPQDLAFIELWPQEGCRININALSGAPLGSQPNQQCRPCLE